MGSKKEYKRQYLWVSQDFYNFIMNEAKKLKNAGFHTSSDGLTHMLMNKVNLPERVEFINLFPKIRWKKKRKPR